MFTSMLLTATLACGQPDEKPAPLVVPVQTSVPPSTVLLQAPTTPPQLGSANGLPPVTEFVMEPAPEEEPAEEADRWLLMRMLDKTGLGERLDNRRLSVSGWVEFAYTASTARASNLPVVWNDLAHTVLLHQLWARFDRAVDTSGTKPSIGGRLDFLYGSDYRYTIMRGFWNGQLTDPNGLQRIHGIDMPQFYGNIYFPNVRQGLEIKVGRMFCPWGVESIEGISTPFLSRSYAFNWSPPFTHFGVMGTLKYSDRWTGYAMVVNGNDVWVSDPSQQWRFVGRIQFTSDSKLTVVSVATSAGSGVFDPNFPLALTTISLPNEPLGRNNFNAFDLVIQRSFARLPRVTTALELIWAYQSNVPGVPTPNGFANWFAAAGYGFFQLTDKIKLQSRIETFGDYQGQRTGFPGTYMSFTGGLVVQPRKGIMIRPEIRGDFHTNAVPFEGQKAILVGALDTIVRW